MIRAPTTIVVSGFNAGRLIQDNSFHFKQLGSVFGSVLHRQPPESLAPFIAASPVGAVDLARDLDKRPTGQPGWVSVERDSPTVDPLELALSRPAGSPAASVAEFSPTAAGGRAGWDASVDAALVEQLVRRVVWGGDRRRGVARIDLDGPLSGTSICLRGEGGALEFELSLGPGVEGTALAERLLERLRARGIAIARWEVR